MWKECWVRRLVRWLAELGWCLVGVARQLHECYLDAFERVAHSFPNVAAGCVVLAKALDLVKLLKECFLL